MSSCSLVQKFTNFNEQLFVCSKVRELLTSSCSFVQKFANLIEQLFICSRVRERLFICSKFREQLFICSKVRKNQKFYFLFLLRVEYTIQSPSFQPPVWHRSRLCFLMKLTGFIGPLLNFSNLQKFFKKVPTVKSYPKIPTKKLMHAR